MHTFLLWGVLTQHPACWAQGGEFCGHHTGGLVIRACSAQQPSAGQGSQAQALEPADAGVTFGADKA